MAPLFTISRHLPSPTAARNYTFVPFNEVERAALRGRTDAVIKVGTVSVACGYGSTPDSRENDKRALCLDHRPAYVYRAFAGANDVEGHMLRPMPTLDEARTLLGFAQTQWGGGLFGDDEEEIS